VLIYGLICSTNKHCALRSLVVLYTSVYIYICLCVCVCVYLCERERDRDRQTDRARQRNTGFRIEADVLKLRGNYMEVKTLTYD